VQSVVGEALDLVLASLPPRVRLRRELGAGHAAVLGDATQIHQVVMNLCANAVQAMGAAPRGGALDVVLGCRDVAEPRNVSTSRLAPGRYVVLAVADSGVGIAPRVLERMFDPFFTTKEIGVGTGLGLSLVHGIVTDLGGGIEVTSEVGRGSTITVYLPCSGDAQPAQPAEEPPMPGRGETVLLIDDEEALVRLGEELMAQLGYEPVGFTSSVAALESFRHTPRRFDIVITDEAMPEMTGSELVRELRKIRPDVPVVMMTGYVSASLLARARQAGINEVLGKPLVSREIARSVAAALRH
jgi:CheY-like chemotaxis protein